jgi:hypothetical protein
MSRTLGAVSFKEGTEENRLRFGITDMIKHSCLPEIYI